MIHHVALLPSQFRPITICPHKFEKTQNWIRQWDTYNQSQPNPGLRGDAPPCTSPFSFRTMTISNASYLERVEKKVVEPEEGEGVVDLEAGDEGTDEVGRLLQSGGIVPAGLGFGLGAAGRGGRGRPNLHLSRLDVVPEIYDDEDHVDSIGKGASIYDVQIIF